VKIKPRLDVQHVPRRDFRQTMPSKQQQPQNQQPQSKKSQSQNSKQPPQSKQAQSSKKSMIKAGA
jgi:hypothetical protein